MVYQLLGPVAAIPQWAAFQKHQRLWRAVRFDRSRVTAEIEKRRSFRPTNIAETAMQDEMLAALGAELSQIHNRLSALGTCMDVETQHGAEASYTIEEMAESRQPLSVEEAFARKSEIELANKEIDALIAAQQTHAPEQSTGTPAPVGAVEPASDVPAPLTTAPTWSLTTSLTRTPGYRWPLFQFLQAAHVAGKPQPKAQDVLDAWKLDPPHGLRVIKSGRRDALEFSLDHGGKKTADLKAIQSAIDGLIV